jgi:hypothetical protein
MQQMQAKTDQQTAVGDAEDILDKRMGHSPGRSGLAEALS